ncbi:hypothetical protein HD553DRAFT_317964 [Filobasidium floriforme]|uniref:uncharacterized protein n=1 Tax=Filobasidium floriforme TaxID=5210 RepID=UPI001E8D2B39|nr:uncharacterized protein HD553DRAFT_317964 [Filobasidium floriforme]KAH8079933.1 hypothetical protein HD553DRAFT_317964 [Filobasidium floriforme]
MPQPALPLNKYLSAQLPAVRENFPAGGGATGERKQYDGVLTGVSIVDDFKSLVSSYAKTLPEKPIAAHPSHPFPHFLTVLPKLPKELKSAQDVQQYLRQLPLAATAATLCALSGTEQGTDYASLSSNSRIDAAGYESDGGEEARLDEAGKAKGGAGEQESHGEEEGDAGKEAKVDVPGPSWGWRFNKSPLGSGEFLLIDEKNPEKVHLVVRTINSSAFSNEDWEEYVYEGPYHYNIKNKASWYHSRNCKASRRLGCRYFVFTDYQRWLFGVFSEDYSHLNITPILPYTASNPTVLESLVYWTRSAIGSEQGYKVNIKDVSGSQAPFDEKSGLARNGSVKKQSKGGVSLGAESDIEE